MPLTNVFVPYGAYWSTPFCRWQGSLAGEHSIELGARVAASVLPSRGVDPTSLDGVVLGTTVPQRHVFYGAPWAAAMMGAPGITGPIVSQACATAARAIATAASDVELGLRSAVLALLCDRTSNGPHVYYPSPTAPGGRGQSSDWVFEAFDHDPWAKNPMIETAERVAQAAGFSRQAQDEICLLRDSQYRDALRNDRAFQRRYMVPVELRRGKKSVITLDADEGVHETTAEGLARLSPVLEGGTVTFGTQTHPADGSAGLLLCSRERAAACSRDRAVQVRVASWGEGRVERGMMPTATVPAARQALARAEIDVSDCKAVKTHNPFAVNDLWFARELGLSLDTFNRYGSPLVYGHPQAPTGARLVIELVEELVEMGGGWGLFAGCAAGDTAMAVVIEVS